MKISYNWLNSIIPLDMSVEAIAATLTDIGLEVEKTETTSSVAGGLEGLLIGMIESKDKHPNADHLSITTVSIGKGKTYKIVCGAPNVKKGQKVVVALPGTTIYPFNKDPLTINKTKIRGVQSFGMICAEDEIGIGEDHDGIIILDKDAPLGKEAKDYFKIEEDAVFDIGLTPNRADAMGHYGVARDLLAALKYKGLAPIDMSLNCFDFKKNISPETDTFKVEIKAKKSCLRYAGIVIDNLKVSESPEWLKTRLTSIDLKPINNIVDVTNFVLHEYGQPLHAFDLNSIKGNKIIVQHLKKGTPFITLDEVTRILDEDDLMICDQEQGMCIAGVFGGITSGVNDNTTAVFIESAYFNPLCIRKTAKKHGMNTDASFRFERGVDPNMIIPALQRAAELIMEIAGGNIASSLIDVYPHPIDDFIVKADLDRIRTLCGIDIDNNEMLHILKLLDIILLEQKETIIRVKVPSYRVDIQREADLAEEILRIYGYNNVSAPEKLKSSLSFSTSTVNSNYLKNKISDQLANLGLIEVLSNSLSKRNYISELNFTNYNDAEHVTLLNPLSSDTEVMRQSLIFNLLEIINYNERNGESNVRIFEFGNVYKNKNNSYKEEENLVIGLFGSQNEEHWFNGAPEVSFFQLKGIVLSIIETLGLESLCQTSTLHNNLYSDGISFIIKKSKIAEIGWSSSELTNYVGLKTPVFIATIFWEKLIEFTQLNKIVFEPLIKHPKVYRDLSILIDNSITFKAIQEMAFKADHSILKNVHLFDVYKDKKMGKGQKSYAVRFELHDKKKTLKDKVIDKVMNKIQHLLIKNLNAELR